MVVRMRYGGVRESIPVQNGDVGKECFLACEDNLGQAILHQLSNLGVTYVGGLKRYIFKTRVQKTLWSKGGRKIRRHRERKEGPGRT